MDIVYQVERIDWDLRVPVVRWAYRAISKNPSAKMTPKLMRRDETIRAEKNPHPTTPTVGTVREDPCKGIMQLQEAIQQGNLKLRELNKDLVWLRKKRMTLDKEISKLETKVAQA